MPIIIRELVIRATINDAFNKAVSELSSVVVSENTEEREALIRECVKQVLEICIRNTY